jgi:hypothetical protein
VVHDVLAAAELEEAAMSAYVEDRPWELLEGKPLGSENNP